MFYGRRGRGAGGNANAVLLRGSLSGIPCLTPHNILYHKLLSILNIIQDAPKVYGGSDLVHKVKTRTAVHLLELVDVEDQRASNCPAGQRLLRVAGGRDQVGNQDV